MTAEELVAEIELAESLGDEGAALYLRAYAKESRTLPGTNDPNPFFGKGIPDSHD